MLKWLSQQQQKNITNSNSVDSSMMMNSVLFEFSDAIIFIHSEYSPLSSWWWLQLKVLVFYTSFFWKNKKNENIQYKTRDYAAYYVKVSFSHFFSTFFSFIKIRFYQITTTTTARHFLDSQNRWKKSVK